MCILIEVSNVGNFSIWRIQFKLFSHIFEYYWETNVRWSLKSYWLSSVDRHFRAIHICVQYFLVKALFSLSSSPSLFLSPSLSSSPSISISSSFFLSSSLLRRIVARGSIASQLSSRVSPNMIEQFYEDHLRVRLHERLTLIELRFWA